MILFKVAFKIFLFVVNTVVRLITYLKLLLPKWFAILKNER